MTRLLHQEVLGAAGAGCVSTLLGHPLDTIKIHLQTTTTNHNRSSLSSWQVAKSLRYGLWRGIYPPLANAIVMNTIMFSVFENMKQSLATETKNDPNHLSASASFVAGICSGIATACISTPADYVKIQAQLSSTHNTPSSSLEIVRRSLSQNGQNPTIFYRGHVANLLREGIFTMVYLGLYDQVHPQGWKEVALTSSLTGALAWVASYPADTIKTISQAQNLSFLEAVQQLWSRGSGSGTGTGTGTGTGAGGVGSIANFYKGCGTSTGRAILVTTSRMMAYEWILGTFD
jgi:solute carrier family 25 carnitine/acylcarnitine transporter 20/29